MQSLICDNRGREKSRESLCGNNEISHKTLLSNARKDLFYRLYCIDKEFYRSVWCIEYTGYTL